MYTRFVLIGFLLVTSAVAQTAEVEHVSRPWAGKPSDLPQASIPAFPGAEGGGAYTTGGRGGRVYVVGNLNDDGPGSFREALQADEPRIVVFNVAGIIKLSRPVHVRSPYITISGATAPGDGVCIAGQTVAIDTHDVIIRYMRFRRGANQNVSRDDSLGGNPVGNIILDHVSGSWGLDENMSLYRHMYKPAAATQALKLATVNITIQNCIFSECLNTNSHAFGSTIGGYNSTFHHNLWACNKARNPSVGMDGDFTLANNVIFNWAHRTVDGGDHQSYYNVINNYFKPGPATHDDAVAYRILKPEPRRGKNVPKDFGKACVNGNVVEGNEKVTKDNWDGGVQIDPDGDKGADKPVEQVLKELRVDKPMPHAPITITSAREAYEFVLNNAGATLPKRDAVDERIVKMVRTGQPTYQNGIITDIAQVGGYPEYTGEPYKDSDGDGMPDEWETKHGLNPNDQSDATKDLTGDRYTNIEKFIHGMLR